MSFQFVEYDSKKIYEELRTDYQNMTSKILQPGSPEDDFIAYCAFRESCLRADINYTGLQNLVNYADLPGLKEIGIMLRVPYSYATPAKTTIKYKFSKVFNEVINIPLDNKVSVNGLYFLAKTNLELAIGETEIEVGSECIEVGEIGNGYLPGEINTIVDPIPYLESVVNITESDGGTNDEDVEVYREKIKAGTSGFSVAGPDEAYIYHTMVAYKNVVDSYVATDEGSGIVKIYPLVTDGIPSQEEINLIQNYFNTTKNIKPLTDKVEVITPTQINYDVSVKYWVLEGTQDIDNLKQTIESSLENYKKWQSEKLGRDLSPDNIIFEMINAGAKRVEVITPIFKSVSENEVAILGNTEILYQGVEK